MRKRLSREEVEREIAALDTLDTKALQEKWAALYDRDPPSRIRAGLLRLGIAYRLQEKAFGGLKPQTVRLLRKLAIDLRAARVPAAGETAVAAEVPLRPSVVQTLNLTPGTRLMREWNGVTEVVDVVANGLVWRGATYRTLSAVAVAITGTKWSGPKFFGLTPPKPRLRGPRMRSPTERVAEVS
ncbi:MAG: DUF2924 domain-containing protein [Devosia sp.]|uniref:DUF2924 domain-containing protein n=1 Tax=Devosia sp. TaxID=1871048 RepID=UPI001AC1157C|nr:DUF2924 domain-containing protein [Devosia sp.]MBN9315318.1 DUF2924 domain-containing protein [Devosia sp.]